MANRNASRSGATSQALNRRIFAALDAGERPTLRGNNLRLGSIVLQNRDGTDRPALREAETQMRARELDMAGVFDSFRPGAPVRRGSSTYATDRAGVEQRLTRRTRNGDIVPTIAGRRFYTQSYSRWLVHIPTINRRKSTGQTFETSQVDRTGEQLGLSTELQARGTVEE